MSKPDGTHPAQQWINAPKYPELWIAISIAVMSAFNAIHDWFDYSYFLAFDPRPCISRFMPVNSHLPPFQKLGYITDCDITDDHGKLTLKNEPARLEGMLPKAEFVAIQYSIVPHVLIHHFEGEWILGNFHKTDPAKIQLSQWHLFQDFGNGVVLWKKSS